MSTSIFPPRPLFTLVSYDGHNAILRRCRMVSTVPPCFFHTAFIHLPYCCHTASIPLPYCFHTVFLSVIQCEFRAKRPLQVPVHAPQRLRTIRSAKAIAARNATEVVSEYHRIMLNARISAAAVVLSGGTSRPRGLPGLPGHGSCRGFPAAPAYLPPDSI